jgi:hypothetical protein
VLLEYLKVTTTVNGLVSLNRHRLAVTNSQHLTTMAKVSYDPKTSHVVDEYVSKTDTQHPFVFAYPDTQTLHTLSPTGVVVGEDGNPFTPPTTP